ncbi:hypothetical protein PO909_009897, partial [Leuciscus waleckii]
AARRSSRIQSRISPWAQWSSEDTIKALEEAGIPTSQGLSKEDLHLLALNTLGTPPFSISSKASTSAAPPKLTGKKRSAKSSSPNPAKRSAIPARLPSSPQIVEPSDTNYQLISAVQSLAQTVKGLESKMSSLEHSFTNTNLSTNPATIPSVIPQFYPLSSGLSNPSNEPSTSSTLPTLPHSIQTPFQAAPAQNFGRRFVSPAAVTVSPHLRNNIIQDTVKMQASLPHEKLLRIRSFLELFSSLRVVSKRDILSLLGHLNFAMSIIPQGRAFISRLLTLAHSTQNLSDSIQLDEGCLSDIKFWTRLLNDWNGISFFYNDAFESSADLHLFTDAAPSIGFGGFFQGQCLFSATSIRLLLKGISKSSSNSPDKRLPITLPLLQRLITSIRNGLFSTYTNILLEAVFLTAFYGFMRPVFLKHSKSDSEGFGVTLTISKINNNFCPFSSMLKFLKIRQRSSKLSPLFILLNGAPLSKAWFRNQLVSVLKSCSLSPSQYTVHSFRIGAATTAAERGISTAAIKILGRWSSSAFESYIRPDPRIILEAQQALQ